MNDTIKILLPTFALFIGYLLAKKLVRLKSFQFLFERNGRFGAIDGLRGYLALFVFAFHFIATWYWKHKGKWECCQEDYYRNLGKVGVAIFFMITGFLFISKIISENGNTDWFKLYQSRVFRIYPLYLFAVFMLSLIVLYKSDFNLKVEPITLIKQYLMWFRFYGSLINDYSYTREIIAGVDWTLKYEWLFYISLPLITVIISKGKMESIVLLLALFLVFVYPQRILDIKTRHFLLFAIGGCTAFLNGSNSVYASFAKSHYCSLVMVVALLASIFFPNTLSITHIFLMSIFFVPVALGNNMFGLLKSKASIFLGEISYSIYLLHGIVLFMLFSLTEKFDVTHLSLIVYLCLLPPLTLLVILISTITYLTIESPSIKYGKNFNLL